MPRKKKIEPEINYTEATLEMVIPKLGDCYDSSKELKMEVLGKEVVFLNKTEFPFMCPHCGESLYSLMTQRAYKSRTSPFELWCRAGCSKIWELGTSELYSLIPSITEAWKSVTVPAAEEQANAPTEHQEHADHTPEDQQPQPDPAFHHPGG